MRGGRFIAELALIQWERGKLRDSTLMDWVAAAKRVGDFLTIDLIESVPCADDFYEAAQERLLRGEVAVARRARRAVLRDLVRGVVARCRGCPGVATCVVAVPTLFTGVRGFEFKRGSLELHDYCGRCARRARARVRRIEAEWW